LRGCIGTDASGGSRRGCERRDDVQKTVHVERNLGLGSCVDAHSYMRHCA
jgi:hypothetical protein